ncbi:head-tail connector protein [Kaistia nematophila]|uniref:Head-tail connector protein n=1 Tax=Kaistia nematophila TaxID=2994654 RepID=A0A9X3E3C3_9HYPH|nr:head-tail connector protein [Kaistia nematophila]MCX5570421.1 head-tail connector protein [Kaistia nematophila]
MTAALISAPATEPVSLADVKAHLRVDGTAEDSLLQAAILAACTHVESETRRKLIAQGWRLYLDEWPSGRAIELPVAPLISVESITLYDIVGAAHVLDPDDYRVDAARLPPRIVAKLRPQAALYDNGIEIDVTAGYGVSSLAVPAALRQAILMLVAHWYEHRGAVGFDRAGDVAPLGFEALIAPYRVRAL